MPTPQEIELLLIDEEIARRRAIKDFAYFVKLCWPLIEPTTSYQDSWHVKALGEHIEAVLDGRVKQLLVNLPPRCSKSTLIAVMLPAYIWAKGGNHAGTKFLFSSYAASLSTRDSLKCRRLLEHPWFKMFFKLDWQLTDDGGNRQDEFTNTKGGYRIATSVGSGVTGKGADILVVDDPMRAVDAHSKTMRQTVIDYFDQELSTRAQDPKRFAKIIVMQRLHPEDLTGHVLKNPTSKTCLLKLPMEFEGKEEPNLIGWQDPRTEPGELLVPGRYGYEELADLRLKLGANGYAGQMQQRPTAIEGALVKRSDFKYYRELPWDASSFTQSWDFATSEKTSADYTVGLVGARRGSQVFILDMVRDRMEFAAARQALKTMTARHPRALKKLVENKSAGVQVIQTLRNEIPGITPTNPKGDKLSRFMSVLPMLTAGNVYLPEGAAWVQDFLEEVCGFAGEGTTAHDDIIDALSQILFDYASTPAPHAPTTISSAGRGRGY